MKVESILRRKGSDVATIAPNADIASAVERLREKGIGALVVSRDGRSVDGILSERDVVRALADHGRALLDTPVAAIMTSDVVTCTPQDTVTRIMGVMTERRIRHLPVLADGILAGIVSIGDVVKNRLEELEAETTVLREYIAGG